MKRCRKCGDTKPLEYFHRNQASADGRQSQCKACAVAYTRRYRTNNREQAKASNRDSAQKRRATKGDHINALRRANRAANPDKYRVRDREWYVKNVERINSHRRLAYASNPMPHLAEVSRWQKLNADWVKAYHQEYGAANERRIKERDRQYRAAHRAERRERNRLWRAANPDKVSDNARRANQLRRALLRGARSEPYLLREILTRDGFRCYLCGKRIDATLRWPDPMSVSIDHIIPLAKGGDDTKENVAATHISCNRVKGARTNGEELGSFDRHRALVP